ncbi:major facilitator superfamily domain-containing protein [Aspergillus pseudodeflectus]|uniref:Major facilitator superfamily domain-containing protein n=1 Tax=Aspergillus pseudodeflectus TaxID=176178 RepID=A0ABR4L4N5_9EURO
MSISDSLTDVAEAPISPTKPWQARIREHLVIVSLYLTLFLSALDVTIVAPALPIIASHLNATTSEYTWVGSAYTLASTSTTPLWAKISDIWGRKTVLMVTNVVFLCGSLICALSVSPIMLIGGRVVQGIGGGGIIVLVTIIIGDLFTLRERAKYYALTGIVWAIASGVGPILGGVFTQTIGWEWCFYINLPFDGLSLILLFFFMQLKPTSAPLTTLRTFDFTGCIFIISGTVCFLYGLESGSGSHGWSSAQTLGLLLGGLALLILFTLYEWHVAKEPILPLRHLLTRPTIPCLLTATFHSITFIPYTYFNPLYFQSVLHISPIKSGVYLFALVLPLSAMTLASGLYVKRTGSYRPVIWISGAIMITGTALFIDFGTHLHLEKIVLYQLVAGLGAGPLFQAPMIAYQSCLEPSMVASGNAALAFLKNLGTSLSLVLGGVVVQGVGGGLLTAGYGDGEGGGTNGGGGGVQQEDFMKGLKALWIFYTATCAVMWIASFGIMRKDLDGKDGGESEVSGSDGEAQVNEKAS